MINKELIKKLKNINIEDIECRGYLYLQESNKNILYEDIVKIEINNFYISIIIGLFYEGLIDKSSISSFMYNYKKFHPTSVLPDNLTLLDVIKISENLLKNKSELKKLYPNEYLETKKFINSLYSHVDIRTKKYINGYIKLLFSDLLKIYGNKILYIDTDTIFFDIKKSEFSSITELNFFEYSVKYIEYIEFNKYKNYACTTVDRSERTFETYGHPEIELIKQKIKQKIRESRLNKLKIEKIK